MRSAKEIKRPLCDIDHVVVIVSKYCNHGVGLSENIKKWGADRLLRTVV